MLHDSISMWYLAQSISEAESSMVVARGWGERGGELRFYGDRVSVLQDENILEKDSSGDCTL